MKTLIKSTHKTNDHYVLHNYDRRIYGKVSDQFIIKLFHEI